MSDAVCMSACEPMLYGFAELANLCMTLWFLQARVCFGFGVLDTSIVLVRLLFLNRIVSSRFTSAIVVLRYSVGSRAFITNLGFSFCLASFLSDIICYCPICWIRLFSSTLLEHSKPSLTGRYFFMCGFIKGDIAFSLGDISGGSDKCYKSW